MSTTGVSPNISPSEFTIDHDKERFLIGENAKGEPLWAGVRTTDNGRLEITSQTGRYTGIEHVAQWEPEVLSNIHASSIQIRRHNLKSLWHNLFTFSNGNNGAQAPIDGSSTQDNDTTTPVKGLAKLEELIGVTNEEFHEASSLLGRFAHVWDETLKDAQKDGEVDVDSEGNSVGNLAKSASGILGTIHRLLDHM